MNTRSKEYRHLHFAIMVIEASARRQRVSASEMYSRLKAQDLITLELLKALMSSIEDKK